MFTLLYYAAACLLWAFLAALAWTAVGPVMLLPVLPLVYVVGYRLIAGRDDPLTRWWKRQSG